MNRLSRLGRLGALGGLLLVASTTHAAVIEVVSDRAIASASAYTCVAPVDLFGNLVGPPECGPRRSGDAISWPALAGPGRVEFSSLAVTAGAGWRSFVGPGGFSVSLDAGAERSGTVGTPVGCGRPPFECEIVALDGGASVTWDMVFRVYGSGARWSTGWVLLGGPIAVEDITPGVTPSPAGELLDGRTYRVIGGLSFAPGLWPPNGGASTLSVTGASIASVPTPATIPLLGLGLLAVGAAVRPRARGRRRAGTATP